jgi:hypothetical protein
MRPAYSYFLESTSNTQDGSEGGMGCLDLEGTMILGARLQGIVSSPESLGRSHPPRS